ncbi:MAG: hypothetical protein ACK5RG_18020 [Cyclobacteriaceae bacterium]|jgi:hypothetical protein
MIKLDLKFSKQIQGTFSPTELNLMLVFQVNCPGCFLHAFPQMNSLYQKYHEQVSFFGLSTAFEDFEWNTADHTQLLVEKGELIGETKRAFSKSAIPGFSLPFPILFDSIISKNDLLNETSLQSATQQLVTINKTPVTEIEQTKLAIKAYFSHFDQVGYTFIRNWLRGTPSFILFDKELTVLSRWFGEMPQNKVEEIIATHLHNKTDK